VNLFKLITIFFSVYSFSSESWIWTGVEIVGQNRVTRDKILSQTPLPIVVGEKYTQNLSSWSKWCSSIKKNFSFSYTRCSSVRYSDFQAFFVVNIVDKGEEHRSKFRAPPRETIALANEDILDTFDSLQKRMWALFEQGVAPKESVTNGYLNYDDKEMSHYVLRLNKLVPNYRENLLDVLKNDKNIEKRGKAATLLNWASDTNDSINEIYVLLDDPSSLVRNNITRFMLHYFSQIKQNIKKYSIINSLALQLERPSHGDRNKAIYGLLKIAKSDASLIPKIKEHAIKEISHIAKHSILSNVRDPAIELSKLIQNYNSQ